MVKNWDGIEIGVHFLINIKLNGIRNFKTNVAQWELEEKTDIRFTYDMGKKGKKVEFIYFKINHNPSAQEKEEIEKQKRLLNLPPDSPERMAVREEAERSLREAREKMEKGEGLF